MKISGAIFDMDGTLVDSLFFWEYIWERIGEKYLNKKGFLPSAEVDKNVRTMPLDKAMIYVNEVYSLGADDEEISAFAEAELLLFYKTKARIKEGACELISYLSELGIKMCIASASFSEHIKITLQRFDLLKYFDKVFSCAEIGLGKDKPDIYLLSAKHLGVDINEICVFEDSFVALETAKGVGFHTVGIFDRNNYGQDRLSSASEIYVSEGQSLATLKDEIKSI